VVTAIENPCFHAFAAWLAAQQSRRPTASPTSARSYFRNDLLRQHVKRPVGYREVILFASMDAVEQCGRLGTSRL
jgi:hypothetical protein